MNADNIGGKAMSDDMQGCERCQKENPIETMTMMDDCWFCESCTTEFQAVFNACDHKFTPHTDQMGDAGQYCERCTGFVHDEDMHTLKS